MRNFDLNRKTAIVTGSLGLLGPQWITALLDCGAKVILTDKFEHESQQLVNMLSVYPRIYEAIVSGICIYEKMDVTNIKDIERIADTFEVHVLVNNAALDPKVSKDAMSNSDRFEEMRISTWREHMSVTLEGTFLCCQIIGNKMIKQNTGGSIVNIASELSVLSPDQRLYEKPDLALEQQTVKPVTYSVAKAGVVALTKYLATYPTFLRAKIRVNSISPSGVYNNHPEDFVKNLSSRIPLGRMANKEEYRGALQFLASDASSYMNGHNLVLDGGKSLW